MKKLFTIALLSCSATIASAQNIQGGLDSWRVYSSGSASSLHAPNGWFGIDSVVFYTYSQFPFFTPDSLLFETNDVHSGAAAARLVSKSMGTLGVLPGVLANANPTIDINNLDFNDPASSIGYIGGTPVNQRMGWLNAWVKYQPAGNDTASIQVQAILNDASTQNTDSVIGSGSLRITANMTNYASISVPVNYINGSVTPTKMLILFVSGSTSSGTAGSTLFVDDINMATVGINDVAAQDPVAVYPNPAQNTVLLNGQAAQAYTWKVYTIDGRLVAQKNFTGSTTADISTLANGIYTYLVLDKAGNTVQQKKLEVLH